MSGKNVELLAPAGNYQALIGAVNAGADAVYLGGDKFSARAYADNFTTQEIIKALRYTHLCGKKLYLTLNTLVKESEFSLIYDYLRPLYESGLDGIIIQDLGVWRYVRENFPNLPLHASTQMTITGVRGASLLKKNGAARIVPARELSLNEIKDIKEKTELEIECFIHGAMCYCYSGQCLFSSILGGRSGNRGRCAQPCRLPYKVSGSGRELYPLSLKDMCTIEYIPQLIGAGIDSFKIEGRMKKPEYAAGVTAIYRKYIDKYYDNGEASYNVDKADMDRLYKLYIRSEVQTGYYDKHNAKEMITLGKGSYLGSDDALLMEIAENYLREEKKFPINISGTFEAGKPAVLNIEGMGITQTTYGENVQQAVKRPMTKEDVLKQLIKMGNYNLYIDNEDITVGENIFIPNAQLNELRRSAVKEFEDKLIVENGFVCSRNMLLNSQSEAQLRLQSKMQSNLQNFQNLDVSLTTDTNHSSENQNEKPIKRCKNHNQHSDSLSIQVNVRNLEQLWAVCEYPCDRIYIESDLYIEEFDRISQYLENRTHFAIFLSLPFVIRARDEAYLERLSCLLDDKIQGFLVRNLEEIEWVMSLEKNVRIKDGMDGSTNYRSNVKYEIVTDSGVYCYNSEAVRFLQEYADECYIPRELNSKEIKQLIIGELKQPDSRGFEKSKDNYPNFSLPVYGTIPMMITANCLKKTTASCTITDTPDLMYLTDRYNTKFPVLCNCKHCYNIIYNSVPYSLHQEWKNIRKTGLFAVRLDFVFENKKQVEEILKYYTGKRDDFPVDKYTSGHYKRGVE
ncbi:MAG: U32 family peptidase [Lachnospiraceae bacterium]|nr:U32 family peptidase [Lachnospiraceae bacterium]